jgi:hypothetical protein
MRSVTQLTPLALVLLTLCTGCSSKDAHLFPPGTKPFQFDFKKVQALTLAKSDPQTGDHWLAVFQPKNGRPRRRTGPSAWEIVSAPGDVLLADRDADETFLVHLLDSLAALKIESSAPRGSMESYGLNPPRFAVQWKLPDRAFELQLGNSLKSPGKSYLTLDGQTIYIASGSAIRLLDLIESFDSLRKKDWSDLRTDDVDQISVYRAGNPVFYAQREGDRWTDRKHQTLLAAADLSGALEEIIRHQPRRMIDDPSEKARIQHKIQGIQGTSNLPAPLEIRITDRLEKTTSMKLGWTSGNLYGISSARPELIFAWDQRLEDKILRGLLRK